MAPQPENVGVTEPLRAKATTMQSLVAVEYDEGNVMVLGSDQELESKVPDARKRTTTGGTGTTATDANHAPRSLMLKLRPQ